MSTVGFKTLLAFPTRWAEPTIDFGLSVLEPNTSLVHYSVNISSFHTSFVHCTDTCFLLVRTKHCSCFTTETRKWHDTTDMTYLTEVSNFFATVSMAWWVVVVLEKSIKRTLYTLNGKRRHVSDTQNFFKVPMWHSIFLGLYILRELEHWLSYWSILSSFLRA